MNSKFLHIQPTVHSRKLKNIIFYSLSPSLLSSDSPSFLSISTPLSIYLFLCLSLFSLYLIFFPLSSLSFSAVFGWVESCLSFSSGHLFLGMRFVLEYGSRWRSGLSRGFCSWVWIMFCFGRMFLGMHFVLGYRSCWRFGLGFNFVSPSSII